MWGKKGNRLCDRWGEGMWIFFFFFKQKTAYEIYQCDWSSDVCSSDLEVKKILQQHNQSLDRNAPEVEHDLSDIAHRISK